MLSIKRRHTAKCIHNRPQHDRHWRRCNCVISAEGTINGELVRESLHTRNWNEASRIVNESESRGYWKSAKTGKPGTKSIEDALNAFMLDAGSEKGRALRDSTLSKYRTLRERLLAFAASRNIHSLNEITPEFVRDFRDSWKMGARSAANTLNSVRCVFKFFLENCWIEKNPAMAVKPPKLPRGEGKKIPFTDEEIKRILDMAKADRELETFILLLRHSGLRISDASFLRRDQIVGNTIHVVTIKTRSAAIIPIHPWLAERLLEVEDKQTGGYLFAVGNMRLATVTDYWRRKIHRIFKALEIKGKTCHAFRHTYATELIADGVPIDIVSRILTHSSVLITERVYFHHIPKNQQRLESEMQKVWALDKAA